MRTGEAFSRVNVMSGGAALATISREGEGGTGGRIIFCERAGGADSGGKVHRYNVKGLPDCRGARRSQSRWVGTA